MNLARNVSKKATGLVLIMSGESKVRTLLLPMSLQQALALAENIPLKFSVRKR